jgi:hypothetical protein
MGNSAEVIVEGVNITHDVCDALTDLCRGDLARAEESQKALMIEERKQSGGVRRTLPWGRLRMRVAPEVYSFWAAKLGAECWQDKEFLGWLEKRFGDLVKIKSKSAQTSVLVA